MQFRQTVDSPPVETSLDELEQEIKLGKVGPKSLIQSKVLTDNEWWTIDNLRFFHKHSPISYPYGEHLLKKLEIQKQREIQQRRLAQLVEAYNNGDFIEENYNLIPLSNIIKDTQVLGAVRFFVLGSFEPEEIYTFTFTSALISIEAVRGANQLWSSLPHLTTRTTASGLWEETSEPFEASEIERKRAVIDREQATTPFHDWSEFLTAAKLAIDCSSPYLDGIAYRHKVQDREINIDVLWSNPMTDEHTHQMNLVNAYDNCLTSVGLKW